MFLILFAIKTYSLIGKIEIRKENYYEKKDTRYFERNEVMDRNNNDCHGFGNYIFGFTSRLQEKARREVGEIR